MSTSPTTTTGQDLSTSGEILKEEFIQPLVADWHPKSERRFSSYVRPFLFGFDGFKVNGL